MTLYHGISIRDAAMIAAVPEQTIRQWLKRGNIGRTTDGQVNPFELQEWVQVKRDQGKAKRHETFQSRRNPYAPHSWGTLGEAG